MKEAPLAHLVRAEFRAVADEIVQAVKVMDGLNRYRFMNDAELRAAWGSASNVLATPRPSVDKGGAAGGEWSGQARGVTSGWGRITQVLLNVSGSRRS